MCRIIGLSGPSTELKAELMHMLMLYASAEPWQIDSYGMTDGRHYIKTEGAYYKTGLERRLPETDHLWLGHVRNASVGSELSIQAAHPYMFRAFHGVHNGFFDLVPHDYALKGPKTDSYEAFLLISNILRKYYEGVIETSTLMRALPQAFEHMYSSDFAIGMHTREAIYFLRNEARQLYVMSGENFRCIHTSASALDQVKQWASRYKGVEFSDPVLLPENQLHCFTMSGAITSTEISWQWAERPKKIKPRSKKK